MNAAEYAAKRAAGICTYGCCRRKATDGVLCKPHRKAQRKIVNRRKKETYWERKTAGLCVVRQCKNAAREDSVFCQSCSEKTLRDHKRYRSSAEGKAWYRKYQRNRREDRAARGLCLRCNEKRVTKTLCETHRREVIARYQQRTGRGPNMKERCSLCKEKGHRANTCTGLPALPALRIEDFAVARSEAA